MAEESFRRKVQIKLWNLIYYCQKIFTRNKHSNLVLIRKQSVVKTAPELITFLKSFIVHAWLATKENEKKREKTFFLNPFYELVCVCVCRS
jgi:hypothetical protein